MNRVILQGRLTKDVELRSTQSGKAVATFTIAVNRKYGKDQADFIDCVAWENTANFISKYFHKGSMILIEGAIQTRTYIDRKDHKRKVVEVLVEQAEFCGDKKAEHRDVSELAKFGNVEFAEADDDGDLPF